MKRIDEIEFLRAVAIVFVLIVHLPVLIGKQALPFFSFSGGVDLFFAVSGFVITRSLMAQRDKPFWEVVPAFWIRRAWRLFPAAWLWLLLPLLATAYLNRSGIWGSLLPSLYDAAAGLLQVANIHFHLCHREGIGLCATGGFPFGVYWSLSLEEQFYALFPFVVFFIPIRYLPYVLGAIAFVQIPLPRVDTMLWMVRTDALMLGALVALINVRPPNFMRHPLVIAGLFLALATASGPYATGILAVLSGSLVWIASVRPPALRPGKFMLWIGTRSYALYLVHFSVYGLATQIWLSLKPWALSQSWVMLLTAIPILYVFAEVTYRFVEVPGREMGRINLGISYRTHPQ